MSHLFSQLHHHRHLACNNRAYLTSHSCMEQTWLELPVKTVERAIVNHNGDIESAAAALYQCFEGGSHEAAGSSLMPTPCASSAAKTVTARA